MGMYTWRNWRDVKDTRELENIREFTSYAIQSQYSASKKILGLAAGFQERIDPHADVKLLYEKMLDIYTAEGFGLDNWGVILGIGRTVPGPGSSDVFGFTGSGLHPFDQFPFVPDAFSGIENVVTLDDESFRLLLLYKALANISASDAATQNKLLSVLIDTGIGGFGNVHGGRVPAYVLEIDTMAIRWVFESPLTALQLAVFRAAGTLTRGAGVGWELYALSYDQVFGFDGGGCNPFDQAAFAPDTSLIINRS